MNTNIKTTNITLTDAISNYIDKRLEKIAHLTANDPTIQCDVEIGRTTTHHNKGEIFRAEIHLTGAGLNIYTSSEKEDLYIAIDDVQSSALHEFTSGKEKSISRIRRGGARVKAMMKGMWPFGKK